MCNLISDWNGWKWNFSGRPLMTSSNRNRAKDNYSFRVRDSKGNCLNSIRYEWSLKSSENGILYFHWHLMKTEFGGLSLTHTHACTHARTRTHTNTRPEMCGREKLEIREIVEKLTIITSVCPSSQNQS
jgi:hypothetical protein